MGFLTVDNVASFWASSKDLAVITSSIVISLRVPEIKVLSLFTFRILIIISLLKRDGLDVPFTDPTLRHDGDRVRIYFKIRASSRYAQTLGYVGFLCS